MTRGSCDCRSIDATRCVKRKWMEHRRSSLSHRELLPGPEHLWGEWDATATAGSATWGLHAGPAIFVALFSLVTLIFAFRVAISSRPAAVGPDEPP
jgi:hypothetical protein